MTKVPYLSLEGWQEKLAQRLRRQQEAQNTKQREKFVLEIPVDTLRRVQELADRLELPAGTLIERAVKTAVKMPPLLRKRSVRGKVERKVTSFNSSPEMQETLRAASKKAREESIFLWQFVDAALRQYKLGSLRPAKRREKKKARG